MLGTNPVKDMDSGLTDIETLFKNWKPRTFWQEVWWWIQYGIWNWIGYRGEVWRYIVRFWQRGLKGYATCDTWCLHFHLASVILGGVKELRDNLHGHPCDVKDLAEWENILEHIMWTFETALNISDNNWVYLEPERRTEAEMKKVLKIYKELNASHVGNKLLAEVKYHVMTYAECERYESGWTLFRRYFFGLWD